MEPDSISVEVIEYTQAELIPFTIIRLRSPSTSSMRPVDVVVSSSRWPVNVPSTNMSSSPKVLLVFSLHQIQELPFFGAVID